MKKIMSALSELFQQLLITLFIMSLIFTYCFRIVDIHGDSMLDTLSTGERVLISLWYKAPECGDIAVINADSTVTLDEQGAVCVSDGIHMTIVKRVIACEGQTVDIDFSTGAVTVDGSRIYEKYVTHGLTHTDEGAFTGKYPVTVPEGCVFVMGDNRSESLDSRSAEIGFVPVKDIEGKVIMKIYPKPERIE